jgi:hypothetical protein
VNVNKRFILGSALALAAVATVIGGVAAAQSAGESSDKPKDQVIEKAAEQLGVDPTTLQDALKQARQQVMLEKLDEYLAKAVTDGKITQAEADAIKAWIQARPAAVDKLGKGMFGFPGMHGRGGHHGPRGFRMHGFHGQLAPDAGESESTETPATGTGLNL